MNAITSTIQNLFNTKSSSKKYECNIKFRIVFISPFFELEVKNGRGWNTVHSQEGAPISEDDPTMQYPILRFTSYKDAVKYATEHMGLTQMAGKAFGVYETPPASYENDTKPRIIDAHVMVDGKSVAPNKVQAPAKRLPSFTVFRSETQAA